MKIDQVTQVVVIRQLESPLTLLIHATGQVSTTGWSNPRLESPDDPRSMDGMLTFTFEADSPTRMVSQVITTITAIRTVKPTNAPEAIVVTACKNSKTVRASEFKPLPLE